MIKKGKIGKIINHSYFKSESGNDEYFLSVNPNKNTSFKENLKEVASAYKLFLKKVKLSEDSQMFCRFFLSDIENQKSELLSSEIFKKSENSSYSIIQQCPLHGGKVSFFSYHINGKNLKKKKINLTDEKWQNTLKVSGLNYDMLFVSNLYNDGYFDSNKQTEQIFNSYNKILKDNKTSLLKNSIRTWIFVRDVDNHYHGMVSARKKIFSKEGLTKDTRFIASTGIEGKSKETNCLVSMDAISVSNLDPKQIVRIEARNHLNPTHEYGVTFERGTKIDFGDRSHLYISGTASIDKNGKIMYEGDVKKQTERTLENMGALLKNANGTTKDLAYAIVYVRNITDIKIVQNVLKNKKLENIPILFVEGAVCRPGWLVEIEGMAITPNKSNWPKFL